MSGELMTGTKKGVALLEAAICHLLVVAGTYFYMRKHYVYYKKQNSPLFRFTKPMFLKKEGRRPDDNYVPQDPYDEFSE